MSKIAPARLRIWKGGGGGVGGSRPPSHAASESGLRMEGWLWGPAFYNTDILQELGDLH